jgi:hypothetical protein
MFQAYCLGRRIKFDADDRGGYGAKTGRMQIQEKRKRKKMRREGGVTNS